MKVKVFDEEHEKDLETEVNKFLNESDVDVIDIKLSSYIWRRTVILFYSSYYI